MKKTLLFVIALSIFFTNAAMADSIAGKFGITARGGASYIFNSEFTDAGIINLGLPWDKDIKPGIGWTAGAGIMYGITDNIAVNFDVFYLQANVKGTSSTTGEISLGTGKTFDFALGAQWRFIPKSRFVPYVGAGFDVLVNKFDVSDDFRNVELDPTLSMTIATTYGAHLSVGADYFLTPNIALNAEIRGLLSTKGDIIADYDTSGIAYGKYNPSNISGFVGIRFFFGGQKEYAATPVKEAAPAPPPPPPPQEMKKEAAATPVVEHKIIEKGRAELRVEFDTNKAIVKPQYEGNIEEVADVMKKYPNLKIVIEGHTDNVGTEKYNLNLSQKRAEAIKQVMVKKFNIDAKRITAKGFGFSKPLDKNTLKTGRQKNRRVEAAVEYEIKK